MTMAAIVVLMNWWAGELQPPFESLPCYPRVVPRLVWIPPGPIIYGSVPLPVMMTTSPVRVCESASAIGFTTGPFNFHIRRCDTAFLLPLQFHRDFSSYRVFISENNVVAIIIRDFAHNRALPRIASAAGAAQHADFPWYSAIPGTLFQANRACARNQRWQ